MTDKKAQPRLWAIAEIVAVFCALELCFWCIRLTPLAEWQRKWFPWGSASHVLMIALPLVILLVRHRKAADYGLSVATMRRGLSWGLVLFVAMGLPTAIAYTCGWVAMKAPSDRPPLLDTIIFQLVFSAFGEELLFRGYFQARLNDAFGRHWKIAGIRFGPGVIIVAILFGIVHLLNPFKPLSGQFRLDWTACVITCFIGVHLGLVREATGTLIAPALVHFAGVWMVYFRGSSAFFVADGVGWALAWSLLFLIPWTTGKAVVGAGSTDRAP